MVDVHRAWKIEFKGLEWEEILKQFKWDFKEQNGRGRIMKDPKNITAAKMEMS